MKAGLKNFEELTEDEFESLSDEEKSKYLEQILGPFEDYGYSSDFDDEDLFSIASREEQISEASSDSDDSGIAVAIQDGNSNESSMDLDKENENTTDNQQESEENPRLLNIGGYSINEETINYPDIIKDLYSIIGNLIDNDETTGETETNDRNEETQPVLSTINLKDIEWEIESPKTPETQKKTAEKPPRTSDETPIETFKRIFTSEIVDTIVSHTNEKARSFYSSYNKSSKRKKIVWRDLTRHEFYSFLGILIAAGANNANTDSSMDMWKITSYPLYRASMSLNRFWNTLRFMRFDEARKTRDQLAPIRHVWSSINSNLYAAYKPGKNNLTLHDQLFPFQGINSFSQYNPSKPAKFGIKIWWVCDSVTSYPLYGEIDTRNRTKSSRADQKTRRSFFTTLSAAKESIVSEENVNCKSDNVMDNILRRFTTHRRTVKWSMALFFNLLDVATFASYVIYHEENNIMKNSSTQRKMFMRQLGEELCMPVVAERARDHQALKILSTRLAIECVLGKSVTEVADKIDTKTPRAPGPKPIVGCCYFCVQDKKRRKTRQSCDDCAKPICSGHSRNFYKCFQCM